MLDWLRRDTWVEQFVTGWQLAYTGLKNAMEFCDLVYKPLVLSRPIRLIERIACNRIDSNFVVFVRLIFVPLERRAELAELLIDGCLVGFESLEDEPRYRRRAC